MKIIDQSASKQAASSGGLTQVFGKLVPAANKPDTSALAVLTSTLARLLDDHYVLIKNHAIKEVKLEIPALVVGPTGMIVFYPSEAGGVFRSTGESWEQLRKQGHRYAPIRPNPIQLVKKMASALQTELAHQQVECRNLEPVVFLANPEIHVDAFQPAVKIVLPDMLERFISGFVNAESINDRQFIRKVLAAVMTEAEKSAANTIYELQDEFTLRELPEVKSDRWKPFPNLPHDEPVIAQRVPFTRRQWAMLMLLILTNIVVLTALVVFVLSTG